MTDHITLKQLLDETSSMIPEIISTTTTKDEQLAALLAILTTHLNLLETISSEIGHPDFEENFRLIRGKMFEVMKLLIEKV